MKFCTNCQKQLEDDALFCGGCGARQPEMSAQPVAPVLEAPEGEGETARLTPVQPVQVQQPVSIPAPAPVKKSVPWWMILIIVIAALAVLGSASYVAYEQEWFGESSSSKDRNDDDDDDDDDKNEDKADEDDEYDDEENAGENEDYIGSVNKGESNKNESNKNETSSNTDVQVDRYYIYTKGEVVGDYYINEWANIKLAITAEWPQGTDAEYATYENDVTECGYLASVQEEGKQLAIVYEDISNSGCTEEEYMTNLVTGLKSTYDSANLAYSTSVPTVKTIAGESYLTAKMHITSADLYQYLCVRKVDNYMIAIVVTSFDWDEIQSVVASIETAR